MQRLRTGLSMTCLGMKKVISIRLGEQGRFRRYFSGLRGARSWRTLKSVKLGLKSESTVRYTDKQQRMGWGQRKCRILRR